MPRSRSRPAMAAAAERFALAGRTIDHGAPVSFLVSSSHGFGMTEGWAEIGDGKHRAADRGRPRHRAACWECSPTDSRAKKLFCQIQLSALELDDTRKPGAYRHGPAPLPLFRQRALASGHRVLVGTFFPAWRSHWRGKMSSEGLSRGRQMGMGGNQKTDGRRPPASPACPMSHQ